MIKTITGNWYRNWSPREEAGERVCRVERLLANEGYSINEGRKVRPVTDRIITDRMMLQTTDEENIWESVGKIIKKTSYGCAGNLHGLIWDVLNIKSECRRVHFGKSSWDEYTAGGIDVSYAIPKASGKPFDYVDLIVRTVKPSHPTSFGDGTPSLIREQTLFDWGNTSRLIVEAHTSNEDFAKKILEVARKKL